MNGKWVLLMATELEALPIIADAACRQVMRAPFASYTSGDLVIVLSGMGKACAAAATAWLIETWHPARVVNAGAAGCVGCAGNLGELFQISQVCDGHHASCESGDTDSICLSAMGALPCARLATYSQPVKTKRARQIASRRADLVDMEGFAVAQTCQQMGVPVHLIKYVSDGADDDDVVSSILALREAACAATMAYVTALACQGGKR